MAAGGGRGRGGGTRSPWCLRAPVLRSPQPSLPRRAAPPAPGALRGYGRPAPGKRRKGSASLGKLPVYAGPGAAPAVPEQEAVAPRGEAALAAGRPKPEASGSALPAERRPAFPRWRRAGSFPPRVAEEPRSVAPRRVWTLTRAQISAGKAQVCGLRQIVQKLIRTS